MSEHPSEDGVTVCPLCSVGCHLEPGPEESRARGVSGPANPNGRLCRKGIGAFDTAGDDRLTRPSIREGGQRRAVSWETAYDHVVDGLEAILDSHGPDALAFLGAPHCTNEENYLLQKLARTLGTNNVDNRARLCHVSSARVLADRLGWPATTNSLDDLREAEVIIVAGANPAERQPIAFNSFVRPAVTDGATLVHVDPVGNRTTRLADVHIAPRPDTDALVFDLLTARVVATEGYDRGFIARRTRGFDAFKAGLEDVAVEEAVATADVDRSDIDRVAESVADADRVAGLVGTGIEGGPGPSNASEAFLHLLLATGNVGRPGTGLTVLRGLVNEQGATDAGCVPDRLPGHQPVTDAEARSRIASEWGLEPPASPGKTARELLASFGEDIRGALVVGENPAISKREQHWIRDRLTDLDLLVVLDLVPSETATHADVLLPAAAGVEKAGTVTNLERRLQRVRRTRMPPGQARSDVSILGDLGTRLFEAADVFEYDDIGAVFDEMTRVAPTHAGVSYTDIDGHGRQWPFHSDGELYRDSFDTPDGRAAFGSVHQVVEARTEGGLHLVTGGRASEFGGDQEGRDRTLRIHPADAMDRGIEQAEAIVVSNDESAVDAAAELDERVRRGTVYLPAAVADPLLRNERSVVTVRPTEDRTDSTE